MYWKEIVDGMRSLKKKIYKRKIESYHLIGSATDIEKYWYYRGVADAHAWDETRLKALIEAYEIL